MRKLALMLVGVCFLVSPGWQLNAFPRDPQIAALKAQQKREDKALKFREHQLKESYKGRSVPSGVRDQQLHELDHEKRLLKEKHKTEMQQLKDRLKMMRGNMR